MLGTAASKAVQPQGVAQAAALSGMAAAEKMAETKRRTVNETEATQHAKVEDDDPSKKNKREGRSDDRRRGETAAEEEPALKSEGRLIDVVV